MIRICLSGAYHGVLAGIAAGACSDVILFVILFVIIKVVVEFIVFSVVIIKFIILSFFVIELVSIQQFFAIVVLQQPDPAATHLSHVHDTDWYAYCSPGAGSTARSGPAPPAAGVRHLSPPVLPVQNICNLLDQSYAPRNRPRANFSSLRPLPRRERPRRPVTRQVPWRLPTPCRSSFRAQCPAVALKAALRSTRRVASTQSRVT